MAKRYKTSPQRRKSQSRYRRRRQQYNDYLSKLKARKEIFAEKGLEFYDPNPLPYRDWKDMRIEKINDLKMDIAEGKRKSIGDVNRELVSDQAYELSSRQAVVLGEYLLENQIDKLQELDLVYKYKDESGVERVNLKKRIDLFMKIRQGEFLEKDIGLWDIINDFRSQHFNMDKAEQQRLIEKWSKAKKKPLTLGMAVKYEVGQTFFNSPE